MIRVDKNEDESYDFLFRQLDITVERGNWNQSPGQDVASIFPDFCIAWPGRPVIGASHKGAVELIGGLDECEAQLARELMGPIDYLCLFHTGVILSTDDGVAAFDFDEAKIVTRQTRGGANYEEVTGRGKSIRYSYNRWTSFRRKLMDMGIPVVSTGNLRGSVQFLADLHGDAVNPHVPTLFRRLIPIRQELACMDMRQRDLALKFMAWNGIGPEIALAVADHFSTFAEFFRFWDSGGGSIADIRVESGKRRIGTSVETKWREAMGLGPVGSGVA